jgi:ABC-type transport system involved in multi-copper enzyme maturation permease subunit
MKMLLYKAWVETRIRFFAGLLAAAIVCIYYIYSHTWLVQMWTNELRNPKGYHFNWMPLGIHEYSWYLWHYLYDNYLQQVWALFAVLFAFGGLIREKSSGTVLFSLGLPVSRKRWLFTRLAVALSESVALSLFAVIVVMISSTFIHQAPSLPQMLLHSALMVAAGVFIIAFGNFCYTLFPGNYLSLVAILVILGVPYLLLQTYMQHLRELGRTTWLAYLDFGHAMAGPWQLTWTTVPWMTLLTTWLLTATFIWAASAYGDRIDY